MNRPCLSCGSLIQRGSYCHTCAQRQPRRLYRESSYVKLRRMMLAAGPLCWLCGVAGADTLDHVTPLAEGGTNDPANLRPAHRSCNSARR